jgi:alpha-glucosidase
MNEPANWAGGNKKTALAATARGPITREWNLYGYNMARASALGWSDRNPSRRTVNITRSGYPGVQRFSVVWHGDNSAWWEHLSLAIRTCVSYSLCGVHYNGPDIPGFFQNPPEDLVVRFFQLGAYLPLFRGHRDIFSRDKEPYAWSDETRELVRAAIRTRYSLLREWYSSYERSVRTGEPLVSPVLLPNGAPAGDSFVLFDKLLVAPVIERDCFSRRVYLPEGDWYRLGDTATRLHGGRFIEEMVGLETCPVFVRAGSILVRSTVGACALETLGNPETYEVYPTRDGAAEGYWYDDDHATAGTSREVRRKLRWVAAVRGVVEEDLRA